jgi:hypothetical protein
VLFDPKHLLIFEAGKGTTFAGDSNLVAKVDQFLAVELEVFGERVDSNWHWAMFLKCWKAAGLWRSGWDGRLAWGR